jgi:hypothetical protein
MITKLKVGDRVKILHQSEQQRYPRITIGTFLGQEREGRTSEVLLIDLRPTAGTSKMPLAWIHTAEKVDSETAVKVNERVR